jgi:hypothetical protein
LSEHLFRECSAGCKTEASRRFPGDCDLDIEPVDGQAVGDAIGPFDECDARVCRPFFGAEVEKFGYRMQAVGVGVVDRQACCVVLQQDECRAADVSRRTVESFDDGSHEACLSCTEVTIEPDDEPGLGGLAEGESQAMGVVFLGGIESHWLHTGRADASRVECGRDAGIDGSRQDAGLRSGMQSREGEGGGFVAECRVI